MSIMVQNVEAVSNISETQAEACAGGPTLRTEVIYYNLQKSSRHVSKAISALMGAIQQV